MGAFRYEDDILKHYVRSAAWLPTARNRLKRIRAKARKHRDVRRLRYFTFCAVGAMDVLMLDVANVIRPSAEGLFDTVVFFDRDRESVVKTQINIPGATGFVGEFTKLVLLNDPEAELAAEAGEALDPPTESIDTVETRRRQLDLAERRLFMNKFPFDVINLDIEEFTFKPNDTLPGRVVNALRKLCAWQRNPIRGGVGRPAVTIDGFSLMFTTQIGPPNIGEEYLGMLSRYLNENLRADAELAATLQARTGHANTGDLRQSDFALFFTLSLPKVLASILMEEDWHVDPEAGVSLYTIDRSHSGGTYTMLHVVMDVKRQSPPREQRAPVPGETVTEEAIRCYREVVRGLFAGAPVAVTEAIVNRDELQKSLDHIEARRAKRNRGFP